MRARAFSASLEPVTPLLRNAHRDTGLPAAASLPATMQACSIFPCAGHGPSNPRSPAARRATRQQPGALRLARRPPVASGNCPEDGGPLHLNGAVPDPAVYEAANLCISAVITVPASIL